ncbi:MAG: hypothetical protein EGS78_07840 [Bacteroidales bacterium]|nr:hypothetical protein [Bacteroidales bacterium]
MHLPVKRVETETVITHVAIGRVQRQNQEKLKHRQAWRGKTLRISGNQSRRAMIFDPLDRRDSGQIRGKILKIRVLRD